MVPIRSCFVFAMTMLLVFILGCDEDGLSHGTVEPLAGEPIIIESAMCLAIDDARPVEITDTFLDSDDRIYLWIYWSNLEPSSEVKILWFEPGADIALFQDSETIDSSSGFAITWFSIERSLQGFEDGDWLVEIHLDGLFERSHIFSVLED